MKRQSLTHRKIIQGAAMGLASGIAMPVWSTFGNNDVPKRILGKTGEKVSMIALDGHHIGRIKDDSESIRLTRQAIDMGVTFLDNAWVIMMADLNADS